jgi:hypothetical protein
MVAPAIESNEGGTTWIFVVPGEPAVIVNAILSFELPFGKKKMDGGALATLGLSEVTAAKKPPGDGADKITCTVCVLPVMSVRLCVEKFKPAATETD